MTNRKETGEMKEIQLEYVLPGNIEKRSFEIIREELRERGICLPADQDPVTRRVSTTRKP